jgi:hypothetical protein
MSEKPTPDYLGKKIGRREILKQFSEVLEAAGRHLPIRVGRMRTRKDVTGLYKRLMITLSRVPRGLSVKLTHEVLCS